MTWWLLFSPTNIFPDFYFPDEFLLEFIETNEDEKVPLVNYEDTDDTDGVPIESDGGLEIIIVDKYVNNIMWKNIFVNIKRMSF